MNRADLILVFGATGKTGYHVANLLLSNGYAVRIVARSKDKVSNIFKQKQISFQKIVEGNLKSQETLRRAFQPSQIYGKVKYVVSALGYSRGQESVEEVEYTSQVRIIQKCKEAGIFKYILVTSIMMQRPWNFISVLLNTIVPDVFVHKARAQNYLRKSSLNYAIVRPSGLVGDQSNTTITNYQIDQGDRINGRITRCTVAQIICQVVKSKQIPDKVTLQCTQLTANATSTPLAQLKPDTQKNIVTANHRTPKFAYAIGLLSIVIPGSFFIISRFLGSS